MNQIYTFLMKPIHLFREDIEEGDLFRAKIDSVEGHRRITLTKVEENEVMELDDK